MGAVLALLRRCFWFFSSRGVGSREIENTHAADEQQTFLPHDVDETVGFDRQLRDSRTKLVPRQSATVCDNVNEDQTSAKHNRRRILKTADVVTQGQSVEDEDKRVLVCISNSLTGNITAGAKESGDAKFPVSRRPGTAGDDHEVEGGPSCEQPVVICGLSDQRKCLFKTAQCGVSVFVYTGDLVKERVDAIVNPASAYLCHSGGAAKVIAAASGEQLQKECERYIIQNELLKETEVMHTSAGNLRPNIRHVVHAAGPSAVAHPNPNELYVALEATFYNCLQYANDVLKAKSIAIPAIGAGNLGAPLRVVALAAYEALTRFDGRNEPANLHTVNYVNVADEATSELLSVFEQQTHQNHQSLVEQPAPHLGLKSDQLADNDGKIHSDVLEIEEFLWR